MDRRELLTGTGAALIAAALPGTAAANVRPGNARLFETVTQVDFGGADGPARLWLPLFGSSSYQRVLNSHWSHDESARVEIVRSSGASILHAQWPDARTNRRLVLTTTVATQDRGPGSAPAVLDETERARWTKPLPGNDRSELVAATARGIVGDVQDPKAQLRRLYDWVVVNTWRDAAVAGCGRGDIETMLKTGQLGGKCVDINRLLVGLARSIGIPARDIYGIRLGESAVFPSLGRSGDVTKAQHCRAEAWIDGEGWLALDPADVRKVILEQKLPPDSPQVRNLAQRLFGGWEANWGAYNTESGIALPGAGSDAQFDFLMYPAAVIAGAPLDCLAPETFAYTILSREVATTRVAA